MTDAPAARCRNCGRVWPAAELDVAGWCQECRALLVRRATWWGRAAGLLAALGIANILGLFVETTRFLIGWIGLVVIGYWLVAKVVRRIAFDLIRARGVPPPEE